MTILTLFILAIGLSFDTFAVSISSGIARKHIIFREAFIIASVFGFFQAIMPVLGWLGGLSIKGLIEPFDHWIAFGLLGAIGVKMIFESFDKDEEKQFNPLNPKVMITMAIATSIDALTVGVSFAIVEVNMLLAFFIIGFITFLVAMLGMLFGKKIGGKTGRRMEILGGLILIIIGSKILFEHFAA